MTGFDPRDVRNEAARLGALVFLEPLTADDLSRMLGRVRDHAARHRPLDRLRHIDALSQRERRCLVLAVKRWEHGEIAAELDISVNSVRTYLRRACDKLGLDGPEAVRVQLRQIQDAD